MKKILFTLALLALVMHGRSQSFEGIIKWSITTEITDPATKAKMEEAQKKMKDPANQAKMKEMETKMNDPQFKAMMESNPQLKAQMENMMKMMQSGDVSSMMPKGLEFKTKNGNTLTKMEGGMMANMEMLYLKDKAQSYRIDRQGKTYSVLPAHSATESTTSPEVKITKTNETAKILDYLCTKYIAESTINDKTTQQIFWTTTAIKDFDMKSLARQRMGNNPQSLFYEKIEGVPLKIEMTMPQGNMVMQATSIKRQSLNASDFTIPSDYKEVDMSFGKH